MREAIYLQQRYRIILSYLGYILLLCSGLMLTPLLGLFSAAEESHLVIHFILPAAIMAITGLAAWRFFRPKEHVILSLQEAGVIVLLSWLFVCLFSAWPFMAISKLNFTLAFFESISGWTTTGLSVVDVSKAPEIILLWRSITQLAGGAGLAIIMLSAIVGPTGPALSVAEGREQLVPHVRHSAKLVLMIYSGYTLFGILALGLAGMGWSDAINHAFAAVSTGGFSTKADSIGYWNSPLIEAVTIPLMIMGNLSFVTAWLILRGKLRPAARNGEIRLMAVVIPLSSLLLFLFVTREIYPDLAKSVRVAIFEATTALTTTGFSTVSYVDWNGLGYILMIVLMLIGGGTCSTAGGIKQYRIYLLWKSFIWELRRTLLPRSTVQDNHVWEAEQKVFVDDARLRQIGTFLFLYLATYLVGSAILTAHGYGLKESLFEYASAIGTVGLSVGVTSATAPPGVLWAEIVGMFLGRLEFFVILTSVAKLLRDSWAMKDAIGKKPSES